MSAPSGTRGAGGEEGAVVGGTAEMIGRAPGGGPGVGLGAPGAVGIGVVEEREAAAETAEGADLGAEAVLEEDITVEGTTAEEAEAARTPASQGQNPGARGNLPLQSLLSGPGATTRRGTPRAVSTRARPADRGERGRRGAGVSKEGRRSRPREAPEEVGALPRKAPSEVLWTR
jgi:hypothetical protein